MAVALSLLTHAFTGFRERFSISGLRPLTQQAPICDFRFSSARFSLVLDFYLGNRWAHPFLVMRRVGEIAAHESQGGGPCLSVHADVHRRVDGV